MIIEGCFYGVTEIRFDPQSGYSVSPVLADEVEKYLQPLCLSSFSNPSFQELDLAQVGLILVEWRRTRTDEFTQMYGCMYQISRLFFSMHSKLLIDRKSFSWSWQKEGGSKAVRIG